MKNKVILLLVRRHAGEVDWILPLLSKYKNEYKIITIFSNQDSFESLKNNKDIFNIWSSISDNYFVISNKDQLFWKIINKILIFFTPIFLKKTKLFNDFQNYVLGKTFDLKYFLSLLKIKILNIKILFLPTVDKSHISQLFKSQNSKILIVRFPEATMITASKEENPNINLSTYSRINGDVFIFSTKNNKEFFLGKNYTNVSKIIYSGFLRYEKWWIKKFFIKDKNPKIFKILVALRGPNQLYFQKSSYIKSIRDVMEIAKKIHSCKVIFKVHPQDKNNYDLLNILNEYEKKSWHISTNHMLKLSHYSNICISILTSACFDSLAKKIPTVEYYDIKKEISLSSQAIKSYHMVFDKKKKKWLTIFNHKNLLQTIFNKDQLEDIILQVYYNKKKKVWKKNFDEFEKLIRNKNNTVNIYKKLNKFQKLLK